MFSVAGLDMRGSNFREFAVLGQQTMFRSFGHFSCSIRWRALKRASINPHEQELTMTIPQNEPGTDIVDADTTKQPKTEGDDSNKDLPLTEADDGNTRTPTEPS